ncbi:peptidoglycan DD-metalloendopeptidase family protein [Sediminitomix flava]|uniref:Murein DD-endopeptidase MepM/ murein hydrolase activator NlpD n=1 Tax=Sediminitomix flava TaxID=379075 RepID=A0A315ZG03_SEDFL|nr:peptidoglycan DD-metalloendopeptidase family protein [Sediminitomix flava]PWJ44060.1 murein DD-endopeptidase MepM/ murein hydrolase activator NlpD [Sediminitomix flava]
MKKYFTLIGGLLAGIAFTSCEKGSGTNNQEQTEETIAIDTLAAVEEVEPNLLYDINIDSLEVHESVIKNGQSLSDILSPYQISYQTIHQIAQNSKEVFDVRKLRKGKKYTVLSEGDSVKHGKYFIYEQSPIDYVVYELTDTLGIYKKEKDVTLVESELSGEISSSLYNAMRDAGGSPMLSGMLENVFAWQVDFFHIQKGDRFKVIYDQKIVEGDTVGIGDIKAAYFKHAGEDFYAILFEHDGNQEYFDEQGKSLRKAFLKAPLKFSRISSRYNPRRFHPVLKRTKPHLGTDYAAPTGTPIYAVGDGVVTHSTYTRANGNYVKIRHNSVYTTQYLHMSKRAKGMVPGKHVKQGEVIGYVGSTGLATGPHLCYRFWKNGKQVDPLREKFPSSKPIEKELKVAYDSIKAPMIQQLDNIELEDDGTDLAM